MQIPEPIDDNERFCTLYNIATDIFGNGILTGRRDYNLVLGRRFISYQMHQEGYSYTVIAKHLVRHHSSIMHMQKQMANVLELPNYYALEIAKWNDFQKRIKEYDEQERNGKAS